jgi:glycosyltransferase involved in cell wall biosynthesis
VLKRLWQRVTGLAPAGATTMGSLEAADRMLAAGEVESAMRLASELVAVADDDGPLLARACRIAHNAGRPDEAAAWARLAGAATRPAGKAEERLLAEAVLRHEVLLRLRCAPRQQPAFEPIHRRVVNLLAYSLPHTSNGYATRSHGLLGALQAAGWDVTPTTRPGYPADTDRALEGAALLAQDVVDTLTYRRLFASSRRVLGHSRYLLAAADEIGAAIRSVRPSLVHAASNYLTALPAAIAAREAGLPFVYEVRGFWDVTRASAEPDFAFSPESRQLRSFEAELLACADAVVTLTGPMRDELVRRGAAAGRVHVAQNAVDAATPLPQRNAGLAARIGLPEGLPVIGYIGSFVDYEGLDDLIEACAQLHGSGRRFHLLLVGDGMARQAVLAQVEAAGLGRVTTAVGRVPHEEVGSYYALIDYCPFPRKPWPVCELVSPLKPYEAMAMGRCVLVSDVAAMAEMVHDGETGMVFAKGNPRALAAALAARLEAGDGAELGQRARRWVLSERSWQRSAGMVAQAYLQAYEVAASRGRALR